MRAIAIFLFLMLVCLSGCVRDQQAARTRVPGVDKKPDHEETEKGAPEDEKDEEKEDEEENDEKPS